MSPLPNQKILFIQNKFQYGCYQCQAILSQFSLLFQHPPLTAMHRINHTVNIESLDILKQECLNIFQATAIYNTQDKDSAYQFIDRCTIYCDKPYRL
jgi:hypothetical protein